MNILALWEHALDHINATARDPAALLAEWRSDHPSKWTDRELLAEYGWVVGSCGLTPHVMLKKWEALGGAFRGWNPAAVAEEPIAVRTAALAVMKSPRKWDAVIAFAEDLARHPGQMQRLAARPLPEVLAWMRTLPWVGENNCYHMARNLGWDCVVKTGPVVRLAAYLEMSAEDLCGRIAAETGERVRTVDLGLWYWGHEVGDAAMKEMASLFRLL